MKNKLYRLTSALVIALGVVVLGYVPASHATLEIKLQDDGGAAVICDDNAACDTNPGTGIINWSTTTAHYTIVVEVAQSKPVIGNASIAILDLNSTNTVNGVGPFPTALLLEATDTGFSVPPFGATGQFISTIGGTLATGASITYDQCVDTSNTPFADTAGGTVTCSGVQSFGPSGNFSGATTTFFPYTGGNFSITEIEHLSDTQQLDTTTDDAKSLVSAAPEPGSLLLLGSGLMGLSFVGRRKWKWPKKNNSNS